MLLYASAGISHLEIPNTRSLVIYVSECSNKCKNCHTPYLHEKYGEKLKENFEKIFDVYQSYFEVLCIMGEGKCTLEDKEELNYIVIMHIVKIKNLLFILVEIAK